MSRLDKALYDRGGVSGLNPKAPLQITEKSFQHRAQAEVECHDCRRLIAKGEPMMVSSLECTQGTRGKTHRYEIHLACYGVVGQVVAELGKDATHSFEGRPGLHKLWKDHHAAIRRADKKLAAMLEQGFGKP